MMQRGDVVDGGFVGSRVPEVSGWRRFLHPNQTRRANGPRTDSTFLWVARSVLLLETPTIRPRDARRWAKCQEGPKAVKGLALQG